MMPWVVKKAKAIFGCLEVLFRPPDAGEVYLNDLWKYNPKTNTWAWMNGSCSTTGQPGIYGTNQGAGDVKNLPKGRNYAVFLGGCLPTLVVWRLFWQVFQSLTLGTNIDFALVIFMGALPIFCPS